MKKSRLPEGGTNLFQEIKAHCADTEKKGRRLLKLSIGQPAGTPFASAQKAAAQAILTNSEAMHSYQDNGSDGEPNFAGRFVGLHNPANLHMRYGDRIAYLPIPGIKPMLGLIPLACGCRGNSRFAMYTHTQPGYPVPIDWAKYLGVWQYNLTTNPENQFLFNIEEEKLAESVKLVMMNYPHNPSGQVSNRNYLRKLCAYCSEHNIRLFNDGAYAILAHTPNHRTLTEVAVEFPELSWAEAFSASKAGNFTGWRIGAMAGSPDFINDIATIKGNTDSGFAAPLAAGVIHLFETDKKSIEAARWVYEHRLNFLIPCLETRGMRLAVKPEAGFFSLWKTPTCAFGQKIENAQHFNFLMIEKTGVVGVHFDPYIRYAVCGDVGAMLLAINEAFDQAKVSYD